MTGFLTSLFGEPLFLKTASRQIAELLAYHFALPFLEPAHRPAEGANILPLSEMAEPTEQVPDSLPRLLQGAVNGLATTLNHRFLFLHASAFVGHGEAILFCGPSGSGKTTLVMVADALGYPVMGEDITVIDWRARLVHGFALPYRPRPFTRRLPPSRRFLKRWSPAASSPWPSVSSTPFFAPCTSSRYGRVNSPITSAMAIP